MIYGIAKDAAGSLTGAIRLDGDDATALPAGYVVCQESDFETAKATVWNTLPLQAQRVLDTWQQTAAMTVAMGATFSAAQKTYIAAVQAIANGTDTTSIVLPTAPSS